MDGRIKNNNMKLTLKERLDLQKTAKIITESQYKKLLKEGAEEIKTPEKAVQYALSAAPKLEKSSDLDALAQKVARDPKLMAQMQKALQKGGISLNEDMSNLDIQDMKTVALNFAKQASTQNINEEDEWEEGGAAAAYMLSFIGGGALAASFTPAIIAAVPSLAHSLINPWVIGAIAGVALVVLARKVYTMINNDNKPNSRYREYRPGDDITSKPSDSNSRTQFGWNPNDY